MVKHTRYQKSRCCFCTTKHFWKIVFLSRWSTHPQSIMSFLSRRAFTRAPTFSRPQIARASTTKPSKVVRTLPQKLRSTVSSAFAPMVETMKRSSAVKSFEQRLERSPALGSRFTSGFASGHSAAMYVQDLAQTIQRQLAHECSL